MNRRFCCCPLTALFVLIALPALGNISPSNVAVIANIRTDLSGMSRRVADYYCDHAGIPRANIIEINVPAAEYIQQLDWNDFVSQIRSKLVSQLHVNPSDPANDPIQTLVLCYGIPDRIEGSGTLTTTSVALDQYLPLLFNSDPDLGPNDIDGDRAANGTNGCPCPYYNQNTDFATFRASAANSINYNDHTWKMRYLVTRLDAYADKMIDVPGYGTMPEDVKNMIDRAAASANQRGKFVLDEPWHSGYQHNWYTGAASSLPSIVGSENVLYDGASSQTFLNQADVMAYASLGMHDGDILTSTDWGRTHNTWKPGSIAIVNESYGCEFIRLADHAWQYLPVTNPLPNNPQVGLISGQPIMRVHLSYTENGGSNGSWTKNYQNYRVSLLDYLGNELGYALTDANGVAEINLNTGVTWPTGNKTSQLQVYYPADDGGYHDGQTLSFTRNNFNPPTFVWDTKQNGNGLEMYVYLKRQTSSEYVRDGCTGFAGCVSEPSAIITDQNVIFPRYASGYTWAEAAYMGCNRLGFKAIFAGDPLMAPYAERPTVNITSPNDGSTSTGTITVAGNAIPSTGTAAITKMEASIMRYRDGSFISEQIFDELNASNISFLFDTTEYPDGPCSIMIKAFENSTNSAYGSTTRNILINNSNSSVTTSITTPSTDGQCVCGTVTVEASVNYPSLVSSVEFWLLSSHGWGLVGTDTTADGSVYSSAFSTESFIDGTYQLMALAHCTDGIAPSTVRSLTITNSPGISITDPDDDFETKDNQFDIMAEITSGISVVQGVNFSIRQSGGVWQSLGTDMSAPYQLSINPSNYSAGACTIRAVPYLTSGNPAVNYAERKVILANGYTLKSSIYAARLVPDGSHIVLENLIVSAYGQSSLDGAFYVTSSDKVSAIRVVENANVNGLSVGDQITLLGQMHASSEGEREIITDFLYRSDHISSPAPVYMSIRNVGGRKPDLYTNGVDQEGISQGLYNVGQLVKVSGRVNYVGDNFVYIDDGSGGTDSSGLKYYPVPLNGDEIPDNADVTGVRVFFGSLAIPKIGDYVAITGISSCKLINGNRARYVRATSGADSILSYQPCYTWLVGYIPRLADANNTHAYQIGEKVRIAADIVTGNFGTYFDANCPAQYMPGCLVDITVNAETALNTTYSNLIIVGTVIDNIFSPLIISPDLIYRGTVGSTGIGALSFCSAVSTAGVYRPVPGPTSDEIINSEYFQRKYNEVGAIGWALSQPDGAVISLKAEMVMSESRDSRVFDIKECFEPTRETQLLLVLDKPVVGLARNMATIDIMNATLITLADGRRTLKNPEAVYLHIDAKGNIAPPAPWFKNLDGTTKALYEWRVKIAP